MQEGEEDRDQGTRPKIHKYFFLFKYDKLVY